jgi:biotin transporter BioY
MAVAETVFVERALGRIFRGMLILGGAGTLAALWMNGWRGGLGFLAGATGSYLNFYWLHRLVEGLAPGGRRPRKWLLMFLATRYLLLGLGGYVIVKVFGLSLIAVLVGLFVPVAAVIGEILYELMYAGT